MFMASNVDAAVSALAAGRMVVVVDDHDREDEGDLVLAAESVTAGQMAFLVAHTTGIVCTPMPVDRADALGLPPMVADNQDEHGTAFTVTVDLEGTGTGVSATARARTCRALADPATTPGRLRRPGHVFPLRARDGGVLARPGHTEAAVDLLRLAGREPVGVISELVGPDGEMLRGAALRAFAAEHGLPVLAIADLARHRRAITPPAEPPVALPAAPAAEPPIAPPAGPAAELPAASPAEPGTALPAGPPAEPVAASSLPTRFGDFRAIAYRSPRDGTEHLALVMGDVAAAGRSARGALVRVHSECLTGDILGSLRCDCGTQLEQALRAVAEEGCGAVVYLRGHEGRGIGLADKIRAYALQETGLDTVDANVALGLPVDARSYHAGALILRHLGVRRLRLITNNPAKCRGLEADGLEVVDRVALPAVETPQNHRYLEAKRDRLGHEFATALNRPA